MLSRRNFMTHFMATFASLLFCRNLPGLSSGDTVIEYVIDYTQSRFTPNEFLNMQTNLFNREKILSLEKKMSEMNKLIKKDVFHENHRFIVRYTFNNETSAIEFRSAADSLKIVNQKASQDLGVKYSRRGA